MIDHNNHSGRESKTFRFFEDMDRIASTGVDVTGEDCSSAGGKFTLFFLLI